MIQWIKKMFKKYRESISYLFFGVVTTVIDFAIFETLCYFYGKDHVLVINIIAWCGAVLFAYVTNKLFVFESRSWEKKVVLSEFGSFISARLISLLIAEAILSINKLWPVNVTILKIISQIVVIVFNFVASKLVIFRKDSQKKESKEE